MKKLSQKNINNIISRHKRGESAIRLAERYGVSRQRIHRILAEYKKTGVTPQLGRCGRKERRLSESEKQIILDAYLESNLGAQSLEKYIENTRSIHISHNLIHSYLLSQNLAKECLKKKKQRKYCRYQREHSMSLWHTDWKEFSLNGERKYLTAFIDDRSRFIVAYGVFDAQTTKNTLIVLQKAIEEYGCPDQIITDNGSQFCAMRTDDQSRHEFGKYLMDMKIKHIRSRVSHPQTNGKIERFFEEIERRLEILGSVEAVVHWQNSLKPHRSLGYRLPEEVFWHAQTPERILGYANSWFWDLEGEDLGEVENV